MDESVAVFCRYVCVAVFFLETIINDSKGVMVLRCGRTHKEVLLMTYDLAG